MASLPPGMDPSKIPIAPPPSPEIQSNFVNPQSKAPTAIGVIVLFTILMFLFVCARMYTKLFVSRSKGWDDFDSPFASRLPLPDDFWA
ncbi:MAG: hypothetical protein Q9196_003390 [Gyalolechia fulgens]